MREIILPPTSTGLRDDIGCAYVVDDPKGRQRCGDPRQPSSSYCPRHHSLCYIACGSKAEIKRLREVEALASAVGGRRARQSAGPSRRFLERLEQAVHGSV
jgi:hypothetical protein